MRKKGICHKCKKEKYLATVLLCSWCYNTKKYGKKQLNETAKKYYAENKEKCILATIKHHQKNRES
jgi:hypothetical protein